MNKDICICNRVLFNYFEDEIVNHLRHCESKESLLSIYPLSSKGIRGGGRGVHYFYCQTELYNLFPFTFSYNI